MRLLGAVAVDAGGGALGGFDSPRLQHLLARLVLGRDAPQSRARIAYELWPESTEAQARTNLRHLLHDLRQGLAGFERFVDVTNQTLQWRSDAPAVVDVLELVEALDDGDLERAVASYGGDLLPACYDDWVVGERDRLRGAATDALATLAVRAGETGDDAAAVAHARRLVQLDPLQELGYRLLMQAFARRGDRVEALRTYHACVDVLERDLGVAPSAPTRALYESLERDAGASGPATAGAADAAPTALSPLIGRNAEWELVRTAWRDAAVGRPGLLLVTGEAGVGKTRLLEELARSCTAEGAPLARTRCYEAGGRLPWAPVVDWLRAPALAPGVAGLPHVWLTELARLLPELRAERPELAEPMPADAALRRRLFDAVTRGLVGTGAPLLLVVDDLQWCDADTIELIGFLLHDAPSARLLVAGTARIAEIDDDHPLAHLRNRLGRDGVLTELHLDRLDAAATASLAAHVSGSELDAATADRLYEDTEGNPLFVVEAVRAGYPAPRTPALSPTVQAVITARLAQLSPDARSLLEVAATVGRAFPVEVLASVSGIAPDALVGALDELWRRQLIRDLGTAYDFTHDKIRDVVLDRISPARRRRLHGVVAEALAEIHAGDLGPVSAQLADHYEQAGLLAEAVDAYRRSAAESVSRFAFGDAIALLRRALAQLERLPGGRRRDERELELRIELGVPLVAREGYASAPAEEVYTRAETLSRRLGRRPDPAVLRGLGLASVVRCRFDRSIRFASALLEIGDDEPTALTEGQYLLGVSEFWRGNLAASREHLLAAITSYRPELGSTHVSRYAQDPKAVCLIRLALTELWCGRLAQAAGSMEEALTFAETLGHPTTHAYVLVYAALIADELGDRARLVEFLDRAEAVWDQEQLVFFMTMADTYRGWIDVLDGVPDGIARLDRVTDGWRSDDQALHLTYALGMLARAHQLAGDVDAGRSVVEKALHWTDAHDQRYLEAELLRIEGELLAAGGDAVGAVATLEQAAATAAGQGAHWLELRAACSLAGLAPGPLSSERLLAARGAVTGGDETNLVRRADALLAAAPQPA